VDLVEVFRLMLRRWPVVAPILMLTCLLGVLLIVGRADAYTATGLYYLSTDQTSPERETLDPFVAAESLSELYDRPSVRSDLVAAGLSQDFTTQLSETASVVNLTIRAGSPEQAQASAQRLVELGQTLLTSAFGEDRMASVRIRSLVEPRTTDATGNDDGTYTIETTVVLTAVPTNRSNPFPPTTGTARSLLELAGSDEFKSIVKSVDPTATFLVATSEDGSGPILSVDATARSPQAARQVHGEIVSALQRHLTRLQNQEQVRADIRTSLQTMLEPSAPVLTPTSVVRPLAGVTLLGGALAVGAAILLETVATNRRRTLRRRSRSRSTKDGRTGGRKRSDQTSDRSDRLSVS
jgi:capsular polysaccharide biosynthesis protein